jgi:tRNA modification GTPase
MLAACLLTPTGRGAIATVAVTGDDAAQTVDRLFLPARDHSVERSPIGRVMFGRWRSLPVDRSQLEAPASESGTFDRKSSVPDDSSADQVCGEDVVVCRTSADQVEIHCHGGAAAVDHILRSLEREGCVIGHWQDWLVSQTDPITADACEALSRATTERCAAILLDQLAGALSVELNRIANLLPARIGDALAALDRLLEYAELGAHLCQPWRVAFIGPPNAGKSSLINAIVGYERSVVFDQPGTTRDVVTVRSVLDGWPVELIDTAGLREVDDPLESQGVERARREMKSADLLIVVHDACDPQTFSIPGEPARSLHVVNKSDLVPQLCDGTANAIQTSALTGAGVDRLMQRIASILVPVVPPAGTPIPFLRKYHRAIERARDLLLQGKAENGRETLMELLRSGPHRPTNR